MALEFIGNEGSRRGRSGGVSELRETETDAYWDVALLPIKYLACELRMTKRVLDRDLGVEFTTSIVQWDDGCIGLLFMPEKANVARVS